MSTASITVPFNGAAPATTEGFRRVLFARATDNHLLATVRALPRKAWGFLTGLARRLADSVAVRAASGYFRAGVSWTLGLLDTAGPVSLATLVLLSTRGREWFEATLKFGWKLITIPFRLAGVPLGWVARHTGAPGRKVRIAATVAYCWTRDSVIDAYGSAMTWLNDHDAHPLADLIRSLAIWRVIGRLGRRFIPDWRIRVMAYVLVTLTMPADSSDTRTLDRIGEALNRGVARLSRAAHRSEAPLTSGHTADSATALSEARADGIAVSTLDADGTPTGTDTWRGVAGKPADDRTVISVPHRGRTVRVTLHRQADGSVVYQYGRHLYAGTLPAEVDDADVAAKIVAAAEGLGQAPSNRASHRGMNRRFGTTPPRPAAAGE